jgi:RNAse (barnase) inhibitor barstar
MIVIDNKSDYYINRIKNNDFFSFSRWGDGEWFCMAGVPGANCDSHTYFPKMKDELNLALKKGNQENNFKAIWPTTHGQISRNLRLIMNHISTNEYKIAWANAIIWEDLVLREGINKLTDVLKEKNFIMVSNSDNANLPINTDFVEIPKVNCYNSKDKIKEDMIKMVEKYENPVFGLSASMATNVIIDELFPIIGDKCFMIDFGSLWEPFSGNVSRTHHKQYLDTKL